MSRGLGDVYKRQVWDTMHDFTTGTVALAMASHPYEEEDYIRDYDEFIEWAGLGKND